MYYLYTMFCYIILFPAYYSNSFLNWQANRTFLRVKSLFFSSLSENWKFGSLSSFSKANNISSVQVNRSWTRRRLEPVFIDLHQFSLELWCRLSWTTFLSDRSIWVSLNLSVNQPVGHCHKQFCQGCHFDYAYSDKSTDLKTKVYSKP